jgi:hypothetical protein
MYHSIVPNTGNLLLVSISMLHAIILQEALSLRSRCWCFLGPLRILYARELYALYARKVHVQYRTVVRSTCLRYTLHATRFTIHQCRSFKFSSSAPKCPGSGTEIIPGKHSDTRIKPLPLTNGHGRYMAVTPERKLVSVGECPYI